VAHVIEINYKNPAKPKGVVGGKVQIPLQSDFRFFSPDGPLKVQFIGNTPVARKVEDVLPDNTDMKATKAGKFPFRCFLTVEGKTVKLDPNDPNAVGGELEVTSGN
jgi:hypothetical protein